MPTNDDFNDDLIGGDENLDMGDENENIGKENPFDSNFDAGVNADEESDPKKYIQQLTGKLSQSLRDYNQTNGETDLDLNKYVAGMIIKQATENLDDNDKKDIIGKINSNDETSNDNIENSNDDLDLSQEPVQTEGKKISFTKKQLKTIKENFGVASLETPNEPRVDNKIKGNVKITPKIKPYIAPDFK